MLKIQIQAIEALRNDWFDRGYGRTDDESGMTELALFIAALDQELNRKAYTEHRMRGFGPFIEERPDVDYFTTLVNCWDRAARDDSVCDIDSEVLLNCAKALNQAINDPYLVYGERIDGYGPMVYAITEEEHNATQETESD